MRLATTHNLFEDMERLVMNFSFLLPLSFLLALCTVSCERKPPHAELPPIPVQTVIVKKQDIPANFDYIGFAESSHLVQINARVEGYLDKIAYIEGGYVKKGDLLFQIDPRQYEASLEEARGLLYQQEAMLWKAIRSVERLRPLYERKAASQKDLDDAVAFQLATEANMYSAYGKVVNAELNLSYTHITSPIDAMASRAIYREGALVGPSIHSLLTTLYQTDPIWITFTVSENDLLKYKKEEKKGTLVFPKDMDFDVEVYLGDKDKLPYKGKVNFATPQLNQTTGTLFVRAVFPNPDQVLKPGQYIKAKLVGAIRPHAIVVPQTAVLQGRTGMYVYVVSSDNKAEVRDITAGDWYGNDWVITSGLNEGDEVIVQGVNRVVPGSTIVRKQSS